MEKIWLIYVHKCKTTGKCYVGQTCRKLEKRWGKNGKNYTEHNNLKFYNAIQKYGWEDFEHFIIAQCNSLEEAYELERYYINKLDTYKNGYNSTLGGAGSKGKVISKELRERLSKSLKGKSSWIRYAPKEKLPMYGKHHTEETKRKLREQKLGSKNPMFGKHTNNRPDSGIPVIQYDINGNFIKEYPSISQAEKETGTVKIARSIKLKIKAGGYIWKIKN